VRRQAQPLQRKKATGCSGLFAGRKKVAKRPETKKEREGGEAFQVCNRPKELKGFAT
jgi:hypothetical protein